ncbi:MAG TPA: RDD family protein [Pyrinomonadaceae bacterium]|nr:RDD family protein [Pyrinomonadaceae bacterium]
MFEQYQTAQYATFWHRLGAYLIDYVLITLVTCPLGMMMGVMGAVAEQSGEAAQAASVGVSILVYGVGIVAGWLYHALTESSSWQGTVGKRVLGIRVTDLDGNRISFGRATGRYFGKILSGMICAVGFIMVLFTERKQGLHDMMAGTLVLQGAGTPGGGVTLNQPPPPPPSDFGQAGYGQGGGYNQGGGSYGQGS